MTTETSARNDLREVARNMRTSELIDVLTNLHAAENVVDADRAERRYLLAALDHSATVDDFKRNDLANRRLSDLVGMLRDAARDEIDRRLPRETT